MLQQQPVARDLRVISSALKMITDMERIGDQAADIAEISPGDTALIIGAGPTGLCTLQCVLLHRPGRVIVCDVDESRLAFVRAHWPEVLTAAPEGLKEFVLAHSDHGGADAVLEGLEGFVAQQRQNFQNYLADQYEIAKAATVTTLPTGEVVLVCCEDSDAILASIQEALAA